jgi:hypothetical protein
MDTRLLDQFDKELEVEYRGEMFHVRDEIADQTGANVHSMKSGLLENLALLQATCTSALRLCIV